VEAVPLFESFLGGLVLFFGIPVQHAHVELDADGGAVVPEHSFGIVEEVVGVENADFDAVGLGDGAVVFLTADLGTDDAGVLAVVEEATELIIASLFRHELVEAGLLDEWRHAAAVIAGNRVARVTDKEGEVELLEQLLGHDRGVVRLRWSVVRERWAVGTRHANSGVLVGGVLRLAVSAVRLARGANTTLRDAQRRSDTRLLLVRRYKVVCDVFDEDTLTLLVLVSFAGLAGVFDIVKPSVRADCTR
jgi:hypothetical protein